MVLNLSCRSQLRGNFFGLIVVNIWNNLPTEIVEAPNVNCFKGRFDRVSGDNKFNSECDTALENKNCSVWRSVNRQLAYTTVWWSWWWSLSRLLFWECGMQFVLLCVSIVQKFHCLTHRICSSTIWWHNRSLCHACTTNWKSAKKIPGLCKGDETLTASLGLGYIYC